MGHTHKADFYDNVPYEDGVFACMLLKNDRRPGADNIKFLSQLASRRPAPDGEAWPWVGLAGFLD